MVSKDTQKEIGLTEGKGYSSAVEHFLSVHKALSAELQKQNNGIGKPKVWWETIALPNHKKTPLYIY